jgi:hypothetical protein
MRFTWRYVFDVRDTDELSESDPKLLRDLELA